MSGCHSLPPPNIPGTPSVVARRGPAKPLHTQKWREWAPGPAHTHTETHYLGWGLHSHQDYKNKHNTIKMGISSSSLSPSHPFPVPTHISYSFPEPTKSIWTTQDKIGKGSIGQVNLQNYELFWCDHCYRGDTECWDTEDQYPCAGFCCSSCLCSHQMAHSRDGNSSLPLPNSRMSNLTSCIKCSKTALWGEKE